MSIYLSTAYLAPIQYFSKLVDSEDVFIEACENYVKQSYRNRCTIVSSNGVIPLSVPVEHRSGAKIPIRDIRVSEHGNWQHIHWNAIVSAYNSSPFFEYYQDDFYPFYHNKFEFLFDFNEQLRDLLFRLLGIDCSIKYTEDYKLDFDSGDTNYRDTMSPKIDWRETDSIFLPQKYYQVFEGKFGFVENVSIIDLLFNMGNESRLILRQTGG